METAGVGSSFSAAAGVQVADPLGALASEDFFNLLITQLTNQDPFEPTGNEELLQQISSIRDIELSTTLTQSLSNLAGQQQFASAAALIGKYVKSLPDEQGLIQAGIAVGVRFEVGGKAVLQLSDGSELALDRVSSIEPPIQAAEALIGTGVAGLDTQAGDSTRLVEGVVTAVRLDESGEVLLELDSGESLRFRDVLGASPLED